MSHSLSQLTSRVSRLAEQVQRAGVGSCRKNHTPMPLVFTIREGEPYPTLPEQPSHCGVRAPAALRPDHHSPYPGPTVTMPGRPLTRAIKRAGGAAAREGRAPTAERRGYRGALLRPRSAVEGMAGQTDGCSDIHVGVRG